MATFSPVNHLLSMDAKVLDQALKWPSFPCPTRLDDLKITSGVFFLHPKRDGEKRTCPNDAFSKHAHTNYIIFWIFLGVKNWIWDPCSKFRWTSRFPCDMFGDLLLKGEHLRLYFVLKDHVPRQNFLKITPEMPSASPWNWRFHLFSTLFFLGTGWLVDDIIKCAQKPAFSLHVCQNLGCVESFPSFLYFQNRPPSPTRTCASASPLDPNSSKGTNPSRLSKAPRGLQNLQRSQVTWAKRLQVHRSLWQRSRCDCQEKMP